MDAEGPQPEIGPEDPTVKLNEEEKSLEDRSIALVNSGAALTSSYPHEKVL